MPKFKIYSVDINGRSFICECDNPNSVGYVWSALIAKYPDWHFEMTVKHKGKDEEITNIYPYK